MKLLIMVSLLGLIFGCRFADEATGPGIPGFNIYELSRIQTPGKAYAVDVYGNKAYIADGNRGLTVVDITNPHFPQIRSNTPTDGTAWDVKFDGNYKAYIANGQGGVKVIDVGYPMGPEIISSYHTDSAFGLDLSGNYLFLADGNFGFKIFNVSAPFNLELISQMTGLVTQPVYSVTVRAGYAYLCSRYGFQILDISNLYSPFPVTHKSYDYVYDVDIVGNTAYFAYEGGLRIYNVGNPNELDELGVWFSPDTARAIKVRGDFAYVALGDMGLSIVNIKDKNNPYEVTYYNPFGAEISDVFLSGRYIFLAAGDEGLIIIEFWP